MYNKEGEFSYIYVQEFCSGDLIITKDEVANMLALLKGQELPPKIQNSAPSNYNLSFERNDECCYINNAFLNSDLGQGRYRCYSRERSAPYQNGSNTFTL